MKRFPASVVSVVAFAANGAPFQNFDFEQAIPKIQPGSVFVLINSALPGWNGTLGDTAQDAVFYHSVTLGSAALVLQDNETGDPRCGKFGLVLISGGPPNGFGPGVSAGIWQQGNVPGDARTLLFDISPFVLDAEFAFDVFVDGESKRINRLGPSVAGVDVSPFAGDTAELRFEAPYFPGLGSGQSSFELDIIRFSNVPLVPEPAAWVLIGVGAAAVLCTSRQKR